MSEHESFLFIIRIASSDIQGDLFLHQALANIKGIGVRLAPMICRIAELPRDMRVGFLTDAEVEKLEKIIKDPASYGIPGYYLNHQKDYEDNKDHHYISQDLIIKLKDDVDRLKKIRSYRGIRHQLGLRLRGQRTRTSGRGGRAVGVEKKKSRG